MKNCELNKKDFVRKTSEEKTGDASQIVLTEHCEISEKEFTEEFAKEHPDWGKLCQCYQKMTRLKLHRISTPKKIDLLRQLAAIYPYNIIDIKISSCSRQKYFVEATIIHIKIACLLAESRHLKCYNNLSRERWIPENGTAEAEILAFFDIINQIKTSEPILKDAMLLWVLQHTTLCKNTALIVLQYLELSTAIVSQKDEDIVATLRALYGYVEFRSGVGHVNEERNLIDVEVKKSNDTEQVMQTLECMGIRFWRKDRQMKLNFSGEINMKTVFKFMQDYYHSVNNNSPLRHMKNFILGAKGSGIGLFSQSNIDKAQEIFSNLDGMLKSIDATEEFRVKKSTLGRAIKYVAAEVKHATNPLSRNFTFKKPLENTLMDLNELQKNVHLYGLHAESLIFKPVYIDLIPKAPTWYQRLKW